MNSISVFLALSMALISCQTVFAFNYQNHDNFWSGLERVRRQAPPDGQGLHQMSHTGPQQMVLRNTIGCEPDGGAMGKRSMPSMDSFPSLAQHFLNDTQSDVKLVSNGTKLPGHKFVLLAKSPKIAEMFKSNPKLKEIDLGVHSLNVFKAFLKYFYTEKYDLNEEPSSTANFEVYQMAKEYGLTNLEMQIEQTMSKNIHLTNYMDVLKFAQKNGMAELIRLWGNFVYMNSNQIVGEEAFMNETLDVTKMVLKALNAPQGYVLMKIKQLMEKYPEQKARDFHNIVYIERCNVEDLIVLNEMEMFDVSVLFNDVVKRFRIMAVTCQGGHRGMDMRIPHRWVPN